MSDSHALAGPQSHPAPHRDRVSLALLFFAVAGAPFGWTLQLLTNYPLAAEACFPNDAPLMFPDIPFVRAILWSVNVFAIGICIAALFASLAAFRALREEYGRERHQILTVSEGRTRYFAVCGVMTSIGFLFATLCTSVSLIVVPTCSG